MTHHEAPQRTVFLVASGDLRQSANRVCWPAQAEMEARLEAAFARRGRRASSRPPVRRAGGHGFIDSQRRGMEVFRWIDPDAPLIVAEAVWQYSHHVLPGLRDHRGPILTVANWSGQWPGLVGMLNLNGSLTKAGVTYSTICGARTSPTTSSSTGCAQWLADGRDRPRHQSTCATLERPDGCPQAERRSARRWPRELQRDKAILGVFDEGCMGMYNAIIADELLQPDAASSRSG